MIIFKKLSLILSGNEQDKKISRNIVGLFLLKVIAFSVSLLMVPLMLNYLEPKKYGIWITLSSLIGWFGFFDIGLSNGLRNSLGAAIANNELKIARSLVSTTLVALVGIAILLAAFFFLANHFISWADFFNAPETFADEVAFVVLMVFLLFTLKFVFGIILTILAIFHRPAIGELINTLIAVASLLGVYVLIKFTNNSLIYVGWVISGSSVIILLFANIWFFKNDFNKISPSIRFFDFSKLRNLVTQGLYFFIIQISALVLFSTDNLIITKLFSPEDVVPYSLAFKMFSIAMIGFSIIMMPYWAAHNEAYAKNNISWIIRTNKNIIFLWLLTVVGILLMLFFSDYIYKYWIGDTVKIPFILSLLMALYVSLHTFISIFVTFIFAAGKIKLQVYLAIFAAILNIPLSYLLAKYFELGPAGVILATILCIAPNIILGPMQYTKIINGKDRGIWGA